VAVRAKTYGNRHAETTADGAKKPNKMQLSGDLADFARFAKGDKDTVEAFQAEVSAALPSKK